MQTRKSTIIREGVYLADLESNASLHSSQLQDALNRPIPVPQYDPQSSLAMSGTTHNSVRSDVPPKPSMQRLASKDSTYRYREDQIKAVRQIGVKEASDKRSRLSFSPSVFQMGNGALSAKQTEKFARLQDAIPEHLQSSSKEPVINYTEPPDGGLMAWAHTVAGHLVVFNAQGLNMSFGIFQAYYQNVMLPDCSPAQIAWIGSFQIFLVFFMSIVVSPLMDKGYFRLCFNGGSTLIFVSVLLTSFCTQWWQLLLVQGIMTGIGMGLVFGSGVIILMTYFSKRIGLATGIAAAGSSTGGIFYPLMANKLFFKIGFAWTARAMALVVLLTLIPANLIARERPGHGNRGKSTMDLSALRDIPYLLMMAGFFFAYLGVYFGFYYIVAFGQSVLLLSPTSSINILIAMNAANLPGRFVPTLISDACIGPINTIIPSTLLAAMILFVWVGCSSYSALLVIACLYGFFAAGLQSLYSATIYSFSPDSSKVGIRMAMTFVAIGLACLIGAPIGGALIQSNDGGYLYAQLFAGGSLTVGAGLLLLARVWKSGWLPMRV